MRRSVVGGARVWGLALAVLGALTLARPRQLAAAAGGAVPDLRVVRVLGARQLAQGVVLAAAPTRAAVLGGAVADLAHAASMAPALAVWPRFRRSELASAVSAAVSGGLGLALLAWHRR